MIIKQIISEARLNFAKSFFLIWQKNFQEIISFYSQEGGKIAAAEKSPKICVIRVRFSYDQTMKWCWIQDLIWESNVVWTSHNTQ